MAIFWHPPHIKPSNDGPPFLTPPIVMTIINDLITRTDVNDPTWHPANANESVHYHHCNYDESCHGCIDLVTIDDSGVSVEWSLCPPSWVPSQGRRNDLIA